MSNKERVIVKIGDPTECETIHLKVMKKIDEHRQQKPIKELRRKAIKAKRKGFWTQEDIDLAKAVGKEVERFFHQQEDNDVEISEMIDDLFWDLI